MRGELRHPDGSPVEGGSISVHPGEVRVMIPPTTAKPVEVWVKMR
jgi:hypothetical protein